MGKRKIAQYTQPVSNKRQVGTVHYVQNDAGSGPVHHQASSQQLPSQGTTTYYQIQQTTNKSTSQPVQQVIRGQTVTVTSQPQSAHQTNAHNSAGSGTVAATTTTTQEYRCIKCQHLFLSKETFLEHCNQFHYFACDLCTNCLFNDLVQLNVHMIKHINKNDMCEKCHLVCNSPEELKVHLGNHITTYNRDDVIFTSQETTTVPVLASNEPAASNGSVPLASVLNDDSLIEQLASELDQSIGKTAKIKPQKYRCGVCKQDFSDPRLLFKHMNLVHINFPLQQQVQAEPPPPPSPPPVIQQTPQTENVVYTSLSPDNIYYDERTGQYYTIALMDHPSPLHESSVSQSVIGYVQDTIQSDQTIEYVEEHPATETIVVEDEPQTTKIIQTAAPTSTIVQHHQSIIQTAPSSRTHTSVSSTPVNSSQQTHSRIQTIQHQQQQQQQSAQQATPVSIATSQHSDDHPPQQLVHITRETDLEELIPTTTLAVAGESETQATVPVGANQKVTPAKSDSGSRQAPNQKCVSCGALFVKKFPKQMYCHACVARNTTAALGKP